MLNVFFLLFFLTFSFFSVHSVLVCTYLLFNNMQFCSRHVSALSSHRKLFSFCKQHQLVTRIRQKKIKMLINIYAFSVKMDSQWSTIINTTTANHTAVPGVHIKGQIKGRDYIFQADKVVVWLYY